MAVGVYLPGIICIIVLLGIMFRLMHYARFYAPSYFFWIGMILALAGVISLFCPLRFLLILNRTIAAFVVSGGVLMSALSLLWPVKMKHSRTEMQIDKFLPDYAFGEFHELSVDVDAGKAKEVFGSTGVKEIPVVHALMKIRGIADDDMKKNYGTTSLVPGSEMISTPDFNFFTVAPDEWLMFMILKSSMFGDKSGKPAPPEITSVEQFTSFNDIGYVKVAANFRFIGNGNGRTILSTETRVYGLSQRDSRIFGFYWRMIYPGSAIIRRLWLDIIKKSAEKSE
jgi:hypothetical protein